MTFNELLDKYRAISFSEHDKEAADKDLMLWNMDDNAIYGEEIFHLGFGEAVEKNLLSDYKVIVLTVSENDIPVAIQAAIAQNNQLPLKADHVDGTMPATTRDEKLSWLKTADTCRILTNVRCLSEGVDVPSFDAVLFLSSRKSKVENVRTRVHKRLSKV